MEEEAVDSSVGIVGREVAIQQTAGAREMVAQQERRRCNNQPATREAQREERDGGVTREGRGGMAKFCTGSTTKGDAARQQVI